MSDAAPSSQLLIYQAENGAIKMDVLFEGEAAWLTQQHMAKLFPITRQNVGQYLHSIFNEGELAQLAVVKNFFTTASDGEKYGTNLSNLDGEKGESEMMDGRNSALGAHIGGNA